MTHGSRYIRTLVSYSSILRCNRLRSSLSVDATYRAANLSRLTSPYSAFHFSSSDTFCIRSTSVPCCLFKRPALISRKRIITVRNLFSSSMYAGVSSLRVSQSSLTINTSERGVPSASVPSCASQSEVNRKKRPSLETLPKGCVLKKGGM